MRRQTILLAILVLGLAFLPARPGAQTALSQAPAQGGAPGRIVGTVTRAGTGDPLAEAVIIVARGGVTLPAALGGIPFDDAIYFDGQIGRLWNWIGLPVVEAGRGGAAVQRGNAQMRTMTDALGQFVVENVPPGQYTVNSQLEGYFGLSIDTAPAAAARASATVTAGNTTEVNIRMVAGGAVSGRVLDPRGRPVTETAVQALRVMYQPDGSTGLQATGSRPTDDHGDFRLFRLPPGEYYIVANPRATNVIEAAQRATQSRTFFPNGVTPASATPITIRGGDEFNGINIEIRNITFAKISGRVTSTIPAAAYEQAPARGQQPAALAAAQAAAAANVDPQVQAFMDEVSKAQEALVAARGRLQEARGVRATAAPAQRGLPAVQLQLFPRDRNALIDPNTGNRSASAQLALPNDGHFEIQNVPPGSYDLYASLPDNTGYAPQLSAGQGGASRSFGRIPLEVRDSDITDVNITVHQGIDINGRVIVDGSPAPLKGTHIALQPDDSATRINIYQQVGRSEPQIAADGSFVIPAVPEAAYRVDVTFGGLGPAQRGRGNTAGLDQETIRGIAAQVQAGGDAQTLLAAARGRLQAAAPAPNPNAYVADVRQNGVSIYDTGFLVGAAPVNSLDVYINSNGGGIAGTVIGANQKPVAGVTVVLVPPQERRRNPALYKTVTTGDDGRFTMTGLPPGEFKLFAWQMLNGAAYLNPAFLARYEERGTSVGIFAGGQLTQEVTLISE